MSHRLGSCWGRSLKCDSCFFFYLETVFELLGDGVEDYGIDAGVDARQVDADIVQHQEETTTTEEERSTLEM